MNKIAAYQQLESMLGAGIPIVTALEEVAGKTPAGALRKALDGVRGDLESGATLADAMGRYPRVFDGVERAMLRVGERSGRFDAVFGRLAQRLETIRKVRRRFLLALAYPVALLHLAFILPPVFKLISEGPAAYLKASLLPLGICYAAVIAAVLLWTASSRAPALLRARGAVLLWCPLTGWFIRRAELARFFSSLEHLYAAGIPIGEAVTVAGESCRNAVMRRSLAGMAPAIYEGNPLSLAMKDVPYFSETARRMTETGERSGDMEPLLARLRERYERGTRQATTALCAALGVAVFLVVAGYIAYVVISFYTDYYGKIMDALPKRGRG